MIKAKKIERERGREREKGEAESRRRKKNKSSPVKITETTAAGTITINQKMTRANGEQRTTEKEPGTFGRKRTEDSDKKGGASAL